MYTKGLNMYIENKYPEFRKITSKINCFYRHITFISNNISYIMDENNYISHEPIDLGIFEQFKLINPTLSIIVMCKDEERCIDRCISSIIEILDKKDELIVLDTGSTDQTLNILKNRFPSIKVTNERWNNDFGSMRNVGIDRAKNDWVFFIDADERIDNESIKFLKLYLKVIDFLKLKNVVISPTIINENYHIVQGVRRIIKKSDGIKYYGIIHEEPRLNKSMYGEDINSISFDNVILYHDGYTKQVMDMKKKDVRNTELLKKMIVLEPNYPRWLYFYCRDGRNLINEIDYEKYLREVISLCGNNKYYKEYKIRALSDLVEFLLIKGNINEAETQLLKLKEISSELSDIFYFETHIKLIKIKHAIHKLLNDTISYRESKNNIEYGSIHSSYFHIDYLIAKLFFEIGEYEKAFNILIKLEENEYGNFKDSYLELYKSVNNYFNNI